MRTYRPARAYRTGLWAGAMASWIAGGVVTLIGLWRWGLAMLEYGPVVVWPWSAPWLGAAAILIVLALWVTVLAFGASRRAVRVLRSGMLIERWRRRTHVPWEAVSAIYTSAIDYRLPLLSAPRVAIRLRSQSGQIVRLPSVLSNADELVTTIKAHTYPRLLEQYRREFNLGHALSFGPLELNKTGLRYGKDSLLWTEVASVTLERGRLRVRFRPDSGRGWKIPASRIPNADLCLQLTSLLGSGS